jgi:hypothetical protein
MAGPMCDPLSQAQSADIQMVGIGVTDLGGARSSVFRRIRAPKARLARLRPVARAYESLRETMMLDESFSAFAMGWPLDIELNPGLILDTASGIPVWEAERAVEGLINGESKYIEMATLALLEAKGCILKMPGEVSAVLIRESDFPACVKVGEPLLLSDEGEAGLNIPS